MKFYAVTITILCWWFYTAAITEARLKNEYKFERDLYFCDFIDEQDKRCLKGKP